MVMQSRATLLWGHILHDVNRATPHHVTNDVTSVQSMIHEVNSLWQILWMLVIGESYCWLTCYKTIFGLPQSVDQTVSLLHNSCWKGLAVCKTFIFCLCTSSWETDGSWNSIITSKQEAYIIDLNFCKMVALFSRPRGRRESASFCPSHAAWERG